MATPRCSRIEQIRLEQGLKRSQLAARVGCSYMHIYNIELGRRNASPEFLYRLAAALDTTIDDVMVRADNGATDKAPS
jgi:transcriptional regulator with XRE-family HTH domain